MQIIRLGREDIDPKRYRWGKVNLPDGYKWKDAHTFRSREYLFPRIEFLKIGTDLVIKFIPCRYLKRKFPDQQAIYLTIQNYHELSASRVICDLCGYDKEERLFLPPLYPLGRHFEEGVLITWHDKNWEDDGKEN